jgi:CHAT domain-containing protein/tetratricopeptide (TPR) repeat protein
MLAALLLVCPATPQRGQVTPGAAEAARQLAGAANDNAAGLEGRREALRKLEEAARLFEGAGELIEAAHALNRAGRLQLILNAPQSALDDHSKALDLLKQSPDAGAEVDGLNGQGAAYIRLNRGGDAERVIGRALSLSEQSGYSRGEAQALLTLSEQQNPSDHALALRTAQKSLALWQTLDDKPSRARAYARVGQYYMAQSALPEAAENYQQALAVWRDLNNPPEQAGVLIMLGYIEFRKGEWWGCISLMTQAQSMIDAGAEPEMMGQIAGAMAETFNENGMPENGLTQYQRALDFYRQSGDAHLVAYATWGLGVTHYLLKEYPEAVADFNQVLATTEKDSLWAQCYEYLGRVYIATGEYDLALTNLQSALAIYTQAGNPLEAAQARGLLGQLSRLQGRPEQARRYYKQALDAFTELSDRLNQAAVYSELGRLELKGGDYAAAQDYLRQSIDVTENVRRVPTSSDLTAAFSATVHDRYEGYGECLMRGHRLNPSLGLDARAFEVSELMRGRSLAEWLRVSGTNLVPGLDPKLADREKLLRQSLRVKEDYRVTLLAGGGKKEELGLLVAELARLEAEYKQVNDAIRALYPSYEQLTRPAAWDLRRIQTEVIADDQTALLEYSLGADESYAWVVTRDRIKSFKLPAEAEIVEAAGRVYKLLARPSAAGSEEDEEDLAAATRELSRMILSPVAAELNKRRLIVVADGALNYIPFQVLPAPSDGEPLVAAYEIVNALSASILGELRQEAARRQPTKLLAAFGNPKFAPDTARAEDRKGAETPSATQQASAARLEGALRDIELSRDSFDPSAIKPLFYAKRELASLRDSASGGETFVAEEFDATRERLLSTDLTQYAILHLATHGFLDPKRPENSGLMLSTFSRDGRSLDGFVGLQDIYQLRAPVDLVVLSACQTGLGKDVRGEGLLGLTRGFMYAGASSVMASLWKVDDEATAELMKRLYANMLREGMTPAAALRAAQNSIRQRPEWRSPHYWAAFTLQGEYGAVIKPARAARAAAWYRTALACGGLLTLLACAAWWHRRRRGPRAAARAERAAC